MEKENIKKIFENTLLPMEILAKERFEIFLRNSSSQKANEVIRKILEDEIRHIELCNKAIKILSK